MNMIFGLNENDILNIKMLGMRTAEETRVLATYNFAAYTFLVTYKSGRTKTIEVMPEYSFSEKQKYNYLISLMGSIEAKHNKAANQQPNVTAPVGLKHESSSNDIYDELKKIKELLDDGVLPEDLYEKERQSLLRKLEENVDADDKEHIQLDSVSKQGNSNPGSRDVVSEQKTASVQPTVDSSLNILIKHNLRRNGEANCVLIIDGRKTKIKDNMYGIEIAPGIHTFRVDRAAIKSNVLDNMEIKAGVKYELSYYTHMFSIDLSIKEL